MPVPQYHVETPRADLSWSQPAIDQASLEIVLASMDQFLPTGAFPIRKVLQQSDRPFRSSGFAAEWLESQVDSAFRCATLALWTLQSSCCVDITNDRGTEPFTLRQSTTCSILFSTHEISHDTWHQGHSLLRRKVKVELWTDDPGATSNEALQCAASSDTVTTVVTVVNHTCWILMLADAAAAMGAKPLKPWTKCTGGLGPSWSFS